MKYIPKMKDPNTYCGRGRRPGITRPDLWITGEDPKRREKYYAWLKHKAQAKYRGEHHDITFEQWETIWPDNLFVKRGRGRDNYCMMMNDLDMGWTANNVIVCTRFEHLQRAIEYRDRS